MSMGLLEHPPRPRELERLYFELARYGAPGLGSRQPWPYSPRGLEDLVVLAGEMLRYDARLLGLLFRLMMDRWTDLNPLRLRTKMALMRWPQALLVVIEFIKLARPDPELRYLSDYLAAGWSRVEPAERFFIDGEVPGSRTALRRLGRNLAPYARWGLIGTERPVADLATRRSLGRYDAGTRRRILLELAERRKEFTLAEYLDALDHTVSRQQALKDLRRQPDLELAGRGRGATWRRKDGRPKVSNR